MNMDPKRFFSRLWLYFRNGHSTYLVFIMSFANFIVIFYRLFIQYIDFLSKIFYNITLFAVCFFLIYVPLAIFIGWSHFKRTPLFTSELDIQYEANPYNYKLIPGKEEELLYPMYSVLVQFMRESTKQNVVKLPQDFEGKLDTIEKKLVKIIEGGYVGTPRRKSMT